MDFAEENKHVKDNRKTAKDEFDEDPGKVSQAMELARRKGEDEWSEVRRRAELDMLMDVYASGSQNVDRIAGRASLLRGMFLDMHGRLDPGSWTFGEDHVFLKRCGRSEIFDEMTPAVGKCQLRIGGEKVRTKKDGVGKVGAESAAGSSNEKGGRCKSPSKLDGWTSCRFLTTVRRSEILDGSIRERLEAANCSEAEGVDP